MAENCCYGDGERPAAISLDAAVLTEIVERQILGELRLVPRRLEATL